MMLDVPAALEALGIEYDERNHEANALCPAHLARTGKNDNSPSWWINLDTGQHLCFSCGYKGNLAQLVCDVNEFYIMGWDNRLRYDYDTAQTWLAEMHSIPVEQLLEMVKALPNRLEAYPKPLEMSEARLAVFEEPPLDVLSSRNITTEAAQAYGVLWDTKRKMWILPLREPHLNRLMGWQEKGTVDRTFRNRPAGLQRAKTLFGADVQNDEIAIIVESPLDCLRIHAAGQVGGLATCGTTLSDEQIKLIRRSDKVICAFDNPNVDKAGKKASDEMRKFARKYSINLFFFNYGGSGKKDPGEMTDEEIRWGIANAKSSVLGELAYVSGDAKALSG
jgi:hypothetical protein